jgi:hypothetical protein
VIRMAAANSAIKDSSGAVWSAAHGFIGGATMQTASSSTPIANTTDDALYRTEHYGMTGFTQSLADGTYVVTLRMAENYFNGSGKRVFSVSAEGHTVLTDIDIYAAVGRHAAYDKSFTVTVTDGTLNLGFVASVNNALVDAIEIEPAPSALRISASPSAIKDAAGTVWSAEHGFTGGWNITNAGPSTVITGTADPALYHTERYGMTGFSQAVPSGTYNVTLKMAENYFTSANSRVFSVTAEGKLELSDIDIFKAVGKHAAYDRSFTVAVTDGTLNLGFIASKNYAVVDAIEISQAAPTTTTAPTNPIPKDPAPVTPTAPGKVKPGPGNTGVPAGVTLKTVYGDLDITTAGTTIDGEDIHGFVEIEAPNVTIKNSIIRGGVATSDIGLVQDTDNSATNFLIEDTELVPAYPSVYIDAIKGWNYTALRINAHGTTDTAKVYGNNVLIEDSWLHDTVQRAHDPDQNNGPSHNDGVQVLSGSNIRILGNNIYGSDNTALMVTQDHGPTSNLWFNDNWADNGTCTVNLDPKPLASMSGITVNDNRFGHHSSGDDCVIWADAHVGLTAVGNVYDDTGKAVRVRTNG